MAVTATQVKELREQTGLPMMQCKKALVEAEGDLERAKDLLKKQGAKMADRKAHRKTGDGLIGTYLHHDGKTGVLVEVNCETDFVARNEDFKGLAKDLSLQIAAFSPLSVRREDLPAEIVEKERAIYLAQMEEDEKMRGKPDAVKRKIVEGKMGKFFAERVLLEQPFIHDDKITVQEHINQLIAKLRENITVRRFARFRVGED